MDGEDGRRRESGGGAEGSARESVEAADRRGAPDHVHGERSDLPVARHAMEGGGQRREEGMVFVPQGPGPLALRQGLGQLEEDRSVVEHHGGDRPARHPKQCGAGQEMPSDGLAPSESGGHRSSKIPLLDRHSWRSGPRVGSLRKFLEARPST
jgi:hypothetical protein